MRSHTVRRKLARSRRALTAMLVLTIFLITACSNETSSSSGPSVSGADDTATDDEPTGDELVLRVGAGAPPSTLNPALGGGVEEVFLSLTYDPLFVRAGSGHEPRLVESWTAESGNTEFEVTLRGGVEFSDGTPLTADAVKANVEYFIEAGGPSQGQLSGISSMEVVDELTLRLTFSEPQPLFTELFSVGAGWMISPAAIDEPQMLATETFGAGPYVLVPEDTVANDTYTYVPNPEYWNPDGVYWDKVIIKVLPDENTALAAITTGQVDVIHGAVGTLDAAEEAGLQLAAGRGIVLGMQLNDREGTLSPPLGDVRVRQAINFAVDREAITQAVIGKAGIATEQLAAPGGVGHNETDFYTYDPDLARELLAEAGYSEGFTLPVVVANAFQQTVVEAIGGELEQIGVTLDISVVEGAAYGESLAEFPASALGWGVPHPHKMGRALWLRGATGVNPFDSSDPMVEELDQQALLADEETQEDLYRQLMRRLVEQAWFVPVGIRPSLLFYRDTVVIDAVPGAALPTPESWRPAG